MNRRQKQEIDAYTRARIFLAEHPLDPPATYGSGAAMLDEVLEHVEALTVDGVTHRREGRAATRKMRALRDELRYVHLRPIAQVARAVLRWAPGIEAALRIPAANLSVEGLLQEAKGVRQAVAPYEARFVANGSPEDFIAQLDAAIEALETSRDGRSRSILLRVSARAGLRDTIQLGRSAIQMLDAVIARRFAGRQDVLAGWRSARRVHDVGVTPRVAAVAPGTRTEAPRSAA